MFTVVKRFAYIDPHASRCHVWNKYRSIFIAGVFEFKIHAPLQYDAQKIITGTRIAQLLWRNMMAKSKYFRKLLIVWGKTNSFDFNQNNSIFLLDNFIILLVSKLRFVFLQLGENCDKRDRDGRLRILIHITVQ